MRTILHLYFTPLYTLIIRLLLLEFVIPNPKVPELPSPKVIDNLSQYNSVEQRSHRKWGNNKPIAVGLLNAGKYSSQASGKLHSHRDNRKLSSPTLAEVSPDLNPLKEQINNQICQIRTKNYQPWKEK